MTPEISDPDIPEPNDAAEVGDDGYEVGYCKPPVATRFKAGTSGNPRGRAKGSRNVATTLTRELNAVVTIQENGKRRQITKLEAILKQQVNQAASGDNRCAQFVLGLTKSIESAPATSVGPLSSEADEQHKQALMLRIRSLVKQTGSSDDQP